MKKVLIALALVAGVMIAGTAQAQLVRSQPTTRVLHILTNWGAVTGELDSTVVSAGAIATVTIDTTEAFVIPFHLAKVAGSTPGQATAVDSSWNFTVSIIEAPSNVSSHTTEVAYVRPVLQVSIDGGNNWAALTDTASCAWSEIGSSDMFQRNFNTYTAPASVPTVNSLRPGMLGRFQLYSGKNGAIQVLLTGYEQL